MIWLQNAVLKYMYTTARPMTNITYLLTNSITACCRRFCHRHRIQC